MSKEQVSMFEELFPYGGKLDEENRWMRISRIMPWEELEKLYARTFSNRGRPGKESRLILGAFTIKHVLTLSDEETMCQIAENAYMQYLCGYEHFQKHPTFDSSTLTRARKRLAKSKFRDFENVLKLRLQELGILKARGMYVDASVIPVDMAYPSDAALLEKGRRYLVCFIKEAGRRLGKKFRTYSRTAQKIFVSFSKKRHKTKRCIRQAVKAGLQFVRRNLRQARDAIDELRKGGHRIPRSVRKRIQVIVEMYEQQREMYRTKMHTIAKRIVSIARPHIRPIVRGKAGHDVEFGPKVSLAYVDGYCFCDVMSHEAYNETNHLAYQVRAFKKRFGKTPDFVSGDQIYGSRENRNYLESRNIRHAFKPLGRPSSDEISESNERWRKKKLVQRGVLMEGIIGHAKEHFGLDRIKARLPETEKLWINLGIMAMNVHTGAKRA
jgi:IS5 family transposase